MEDKKSVTEQKCRKRITLCIEKEMYSDAEVLGWDIEQKIDDFIDDLKEQDPECEVTVSFD